MTLLNRIPHQDDEAKWKLEKLERNGRVGTREHRFIEAIFVGIASGGSGRRRHYTWQAVFGNEKSHLRPAASFFLSSINSDKGNAKSDG